MKPAGVISSFKSAAGVPFKVVLIESPFASMRNLFQSLALKAFLSRLVLFQIHEPSAPAFIIDAAGPGARGRIDFDLIAMHAARGNVDGFAVVLDFRRLVEHVTPNLHARVQTA